MVYPDDKVQPAKVKPELPPPTRKASPGKPKDATGREQPNASSTARSALPPSDDAKRPDRAETPARRNINAASDLRRIDDHFSYESIDRALKANLARLTLGLSPAVLAEQTFDWLVHLAVSPGKQLQLVENWLRMVGQFGLYAAQSTANSEVPPFIRPSPQDRRFAGEGWQKWPHNLVYQYFLFLEQWWDHATTGVDGVAQRNERRLSFTARQVLDVFSPSNYLWTNPEVASKTIAEGGRNLVQGFQNLRSGTRRILALPATGEMMCFSLPASSLTALSKAGNMLAKQLTFMAGADAAGIVLGVRIPIILTSRADNLRTRLASAAVAVLLAHSRRQAPAAVAA